MRLVVALTGGTLRVEVHDPGRGFELKRAAGRPAARLGLGPRARRGARGPLGRRPQPAHAGVVRDGLEPSALGLRLRLGFEPLLEPFDARTPSSCPGVLDRGEARLERGHQVRHASRARAPRAGRRSPRRRPSSRSARAPSRGTRRGSCDGSNSLESESISCWAILSSRSVALSSLPSGRSSMSSRRHDLVVEEHRLHHQDVAGRADRDELLLGAQHDAGDGDLVGLLHRPQQEPVRLRRALVGDEVVRVVVVDGVDLVEVDEVLDVDRARLLRVQRRRAPRA